MDPKRALAILVAIWAFLIEEMAFGLLTGAVMEFFDHSRENVQGPRWSDVLQGIANGFEVAMLLGTIAGLLYLYAQVRG